MGDGFFEVGTNVGRYTGQCSLDFDNGVLVPRSYCGNHLIVLLGDFLEVVFFSEKEFIFQISSFGLLKKFGKFVNRARNAVGHENAD